jgi:hypothetical protein
LSNSFSLTGKHVCDNDISAGIGQPQGKHPAYSASGARHNPNLSR